MRRLHLCLICLAADSSCRPRARKSASTSLPAFRSSAISCATSAATASSVTTLVGPDGDVHVYTPAPADAKKIADAKLARRQRPRPRRLAAAAGAVLRRQGCHRDRDRRHRAAQSSARLPIRMPGNPSPMPRSTSPISATRWPPPIRRMPRPTAPMRKPIWRSSTRSTARCAAAIAQIPPARRKVISTHDAFGYFAAAYGIEFIAPLGRFHRIRAQRPRYRRHHHPDQDRENPGGVSRKYQRPQADPADRGRDRRQVGGTLYSDSLTAEKGDAPTYIDMVRHNIKALTSALAN